MKYFTTTGFGQSDVNSIRINNETTSFDDALVDGDIGNYNIYYYTSVLPANAKEVKFPKLKWGSVLPCIMARADGVKGERICAGVLVIKITKPNGKLLGSLAIEYAGNDESKQVSLEKLMTAVPDMIGRRGFGGILNGGVTTMGYKLVIDKFIYKNNLITKNFGTVLASICFI